MSREREAAEKVEAVALEGEIKYENIPVDMDVTLPVLVEETGEIMQVVQGARQAYRETSQRVNRLQSLLGCLHT